MAGNDIFQLTISGETLQNILNKANIAIDQNAIVKVANGGTGLTSFPSNAILITQDTTSLIGIPIKNGAFFKENGTEKPFFGTLPIAYGGTGVTSLNELRKQLTSIPLTMTEGGTGVNKLTNGSVAIIKDNKFNSLQGNNNQILMYQNGAPVYQNQTQITKVGNITEGTWNADVIAINKGGTGVTNLNNLRRSLNLGDDITKPISIFHGGTNATTAEQARNNLGITPNNIGAVSVNDIIQIEKGGTGAISTEQARNNLEITPNNIGAVSVEAIIQIEKGGTGASSASLAISNLLEEKPLSEFNGGTGKTSFRQALNDHNVITSDNLISSIVSGIKIITESMLQTATDSGAKYYPLDASYCGSMIEVTTTSSTTILLPNFISITDKFELEIFRFSSQDMYISSSNGDSIYCSGLTAPTTTVKISENYSAIGVKRLSNNKWLITGGVELPQ